MFWPWKNRRTPTPISHHCYMWFGFLSGGCLLMLGFVDLVTMVTGDTADALWAAFKAFGSLGMVPLAIFLFKHRSQQCAWCKVLEGEPHPDALKALRVLARASRAVAAYHFIESFVFTTLVATVALVLLSSVALDAFWGSLALALGGAWLIALDLITNGHRRLRHGCEPCNA